jgi:hypothetical protein
MRDRGFTSDGFLALIATGLVLDLGSYRTYLGGPAPSPLLVRIVARVRNRGNPINRGGLTPAVISSLRLMEV